MLLTSKLFDNGPINDVDRGQYIRDYIQSQQRYASEHARDGKKYFSFLTLHGSSSETVSSLMVQAEHDKGHHTDSKEAISPGNLVSGGFSSPVLKPRAPEKINEKQGIGIKVDDSGNRRAQTTKLLLPGSLYNEQGNKDENDEVVLRTSHVS